MQAMYSDLQQEYTQEYSKMQTNELQRAQKQVTELQNTLSILENEYTDTMNKIVDMAVQKMNSVTEKNDEKADYVSGTLCRLACLS